MIDLTDLRLIMDEIGEILDENDLKEMINSTGSINGKVNFEQFSSVLSSATEDVKHLTTNYIAENTHL